MTIRNGNWAQISLVDNQAEDPSFKKTHRRVDNLESDINQVGPSVAGLNRRKVYSAVSETTTQPENVKTKAHVSQSKVNTKREPMIELNLTGL